MIKHLTKWGGGGAYKATKNDRIAAQKGSYPAKNILISIIAIIFAMLYSVINFNIITLTSRVNAVQVSDDCYLRILSSGYDFSKFQEENDWCINSTDCIVLYTFGDGNWFGVKSATLPIIQLQNIIGKKIQLEVAFGGDKHIYNEDNLTITGYSESDFTTKGEYISNGYYNYYLDITIVELETVAISIDYKDAGGGEFSGTHTSGYSTSHTNGETTTLDTPTKQDYIFVGWYLNDPTCAESNKVTSLSADIEYETITLYAKWTPNLVTITLNCTNYSSAKPNYMIYLYKNDELVTQSVPTTQQIVLEIPAIDIVNGDTYTFAFVYGYYGQLTVTSQDGITINNRKITITSTTDKTISYTLYTPLINSSILI